MVAAELKLNESNTCARLTRGARKASSAVCVCRGCAAPHVPVRRIVAASDQCALARVKSVPEKCMVNGNGGS